MMALTAVAGRGEFMKDNNVKVLIIEDNKADMRLMQEFLSEASCQSRTFEVTGAGSLSQALKLLETGGYDVILSDLFLPDSSGLGTFAAVSSRVPDMPVVLLTGLEDEAVAEEAISAGAQDYLFKKKVNVENLPRSIMYAMERKSIEARLRASEERYRTLIDALDDVIVVVDPELRIIMSNRAFKKAVGADSLGPANSGRQFMAAVSVLPERTMEICGRAFLDGKMVVSEEPCLWNDRQSILEIKCVPVTAGGKAQRVVVVARDISARKQVEELKDDFASLVSHELRNPLTTVLAGLAMVRETADTRLDKTEKQLLSLSYSEAQRLSRIIAKLLEMSRLEAGTSSFKRTMSDVVKLAGEAVTRFASRAKSRNIELLGKYSVEKAETLLDVDGITEVFTNLLSNALKFTEKGRVEIGVSERGNSIECYVKDSGIGISSENQPKLFSKFKQFGKPVAEDEKGTGLGLFIVKEILRRHNGTLSVSSGTGRGATFSFTLPKVREEQNSANNGKKGSIIYPEI